MKDNKYSFFESYHKALSRVSDERYGRVVRAMSEFAFKGIAPSFADDADWIVWELVKPIIERGQEISEARAEAGRKGGSNGKGVTRNKGNRNAAKDESKTIANNSNQKQNNSGIGIGIGIGKDNNKLTNVSIGRLPDDLLVSFEKFWSMYDKKRKRPACEKKWALMTEEQRQLALTHAPKYAASTPEKRYRKDPLTYLNGECWNDEIIQEPGTATPTEDAPYIDDKHKFDNEEDW